MIAALYVQPDGPYANREGVDAWPEERDARLYAGPWPVVAHPPCARWGRYWSGGPNASYRRELGDDAGCFAAALASVRRWGGVLEHPEATYGWKKFRINTPPKGGGWISAGLCGGWTCCVEQGHYGHAARKATWLYVHGIVGSALPALAWGPAASPDRLRLDQGFHSRADRIAAGRSGRDQSFRRLSARQRTITPPAFAELLISIAEPAQPADVPGAQVLIESQQHREQTRRAESEGGTMKRECIFDADGGSAIDPIRDPIGGKLEGGSLIDPVGGRE